MLNVIQRPGRTTVLFERDPILTSVDEHLIFRAFRIENLKLRPYGPVELVGLVPSCFYGDALLRCTVRCRQEGENRLRLTLTPAKVEGGLLDLVREEREILIEYRPELGRFRYTIACRLEFLRDLKGGEPRLFLTGMQPLQCPGDDYAVIEFDDPLLSGGVGPQVPMTQDWTGLPEPVLGEDNYTTRWEKRYLSVVLPTAARGLRKVTFNRVVNGNQKFFNRLIPCTAPRQPYLYERKDGGFVLFTPLHAYPGSHHICEWGYDMHWYAMLDRPAPGLLFRKGQRVDLAYQIEEIVRAEVPAGYLDAVPAELETEERALSDRPIYEEPVCHFARSTLDCPDQYGWQPGERCEWNRAGGRTAGTGALEIRNGVEARESAWLFRHFGPSYACNPIPPASRFRVSGWVRADDPDKAVVEITLNHYNGPAMFSSGVPVVSAGRVGERAARDGDWRRLEFVSAPSGSYTISGSFRFAYAGRGTAALTEFSVERL